MPVLPSHAGNRKKPAYYRLSSQVLLHPKLRSSDLLGRKKDVPGGAKKVPGVSSPTSRAYA